MPDSRSNLERETEYCVFKLNPLSGWGEKPVSKVQNTLRGCFELVMAVREILMLEGQPAVHIEGVVVAHLILRTVELGISHILQRHP